MNTWLLIGSIILFILAVAIILVVLLQEGHQANISGAIAGGADSFLSSGKAKTLDSFLAKWTKGFIVVFMIMALLCDFLMYLK